MIFQSLVRTYCYFEKNRFEIFSHENPTLALYSAYVLSSKILSYLLVFIIANFLYLLRLNFMVFLPSLSAVSILIIEGVVGMGGGAGWGGMGRGGWGRTGGMGGGKNHPPPGTPHEQP